jgi:GNAT superfamily N-acetyltransferase
MRRELGDDYELDDDPARVDVVAVHRFLCDESYWARGRDFAMQEELIRTASRVVGLYHRGEQVGFCRAVATPAVYLADVYVLVEHRGRGLGEAMIEEMVERGPYADRAWLLHTADAHELYCKFGFGPPGERVMERPRPGPDPSDAAIRRGRT